MATKITELTSMPAALDIADVFPLVDTSAGVTYKVAFSALIDKFRYDSVYVKLTGEQETPQAETGVMTMVVPASMNGWKVIGLDLYVPTVGSAGSTRVYARNVTQGVYIGTTYVSLAYNYNSTYAAGTGLSSFSHTLATGNILRFDINQVATGIKGLDLIMKVDKL
jgi:hypothetical protein